MLKVMMMTKKTEGYKVAGYVETVEEARERVTQLQRLYTPIDVYYTTE